MTPRSDRPLRLWIVHQNATLPEQGGLPRAHHLGRALGRRGYQVTIIAGSFVQGTGQNLLRPEESRRAEFHEGVEVIWLRTPGHRGGAWSWIGNMLAFGWRVRGEWPTAAAAPDLVLGSTPPSLAALAAERLAARIGVPFVLEVRDLWPDTLVERGSLAIWSPFGPVLGWIERFLHRRAAQIVTTLPQAAERIRAKGAASTRTTWLPEPADPVAATTAAAEGRRTARPSYDRLAEALDRTLRAALDLPAAPCAEAAETAIESVTMADQRERRPVESHRKGD
jgi:hypothetical protein